MGDPFGENTGVSSFGGSVECPLSIQSGDLEGKVLMVILAYCGQCIKNCWCGFPSSALFALSTMAAIMEKDMVKRIPKLCELWVVDFEYDSQNGCPKPRAMRVF